MLHAALHLTDHARADIEAIDTSVALAAPGVVAVFTADDLPGALRVGIIYKDWPVMIPVGGRTSYAGDVLAVVVADTRDHARAAAALVEVTYDVHSPNTDARAALHETAPLSVWGTDSNVLSTSAYTRGTDFDDAFAASAFTVHETFRTQRIEHAFLEPESTVAIPTGDDGDRTLHVYSGGQGVWDDRNDIAAVLDVDASRVTVELVSNGGAFGGKEDMSNQAQTALAAWKLGRPVKCTLSREESFRMHAKRHPIELEYWAGCDADGRVTALKVRGIGDSGAYASVGMKVLERAAGHACGPYRWPSLDIETIAVRTNNLVCGAFRGFGANQAQFAMEGVLDRLAEQVGISGWEIRKRNVIKPGDEWGPGQIMDDGAGGAEACLDEIKASYDAAIASGKAVGLGLGLKNSGLGNGFREVSKAVVRFVAPVGDAPGRIEVRHGWTEMGQGVHTVALQVAAQELGVDPERIDVIVDTTRELGFGQTTGSRGTLMVAGSVSDAAAAASGGRVRDRGRLRRRVRRRLDAEARRPGGEEPDDPRRVQLRGTDGHRRPRDGRHREGRRRPRRRQGGQSDARGGPGRGQRAHGARLRTDRGFPDRSRDGLPDEHDAALARHPAREGRAGDRGASRRGAPAPIAVRHQGSRRDRTRAHGTRRRRSPPRRRRRVAILPPHAPLTPLPAQPPTPPSRLRDAFVGTAQRNCNANGSAGRGRVDQPGGGSPRR